MTTQTQRNAAHWRKYALAVEALRAIAATEPTDEASDGASNHGRELDACIDEMHAIANDALAQLVSA